MGLINQIFLWLFIFIVGSLIVSFLIYPSSFNSFKSNVKSISGDVIENVKSFESDVQQKSINLESDNYCEENTILEELKILAPYSIETKEQPISKQMAVRFLKWKDGTKMHKYDYFGMDETCRIGSEQGENINYRYCDFVYSKTIQNVLDNGVVEGYDERNYDVTLIIDKEPYKDEPSEKSNYYYLYYYIRDYKCLRI